MTSRVFRGAATDVEAQQLTAENAAEISQWCGGELLTHNGHPRGILIYRLDGNDFAHIGDYIIRNAFFFRSVRADIFEDKYTELKGDRHERRN